jgi:hypothetical protein
LSLSLLHRDRCSLCHGLVDRRCQVFPNS